MTEQTRLPPTREIGAALRKTTERLARELATPTDEAPVWSDFEWRAAMAASVMHGVSALLANRLRWRGPVFWEAFLAEQKEQGLLRQQRIEALLARMHAAAEQAGLGLLALKGSALLTMALYEPGERPMSDIDLLVREEDFDAAAQLLESLDYERELMNWKHLNLVPRDMLAAPHLGEHVDNPIKFDLHTRVVERMPVNEVEITAHTLPAQMRCGLNSYPSQIALMRHLLMHTAGNLREKAIRLIQMQDIARLAQRLSPAEWQTLLSNAADMWWALPPLSMVERYLPGTIPPLALDRLRTACQPWLRLSLHQQCVADVSLSRIELPALPGLEWSRSPADPLMMGFKRIFPDRVPPMPKRATEGAWPAASDSDWTVRSRLWKIVRWMAARPARVPTLNAVLLAVAYPAP